MGHGQSNGHVTDDVTWPWRSFKVATQICLRLSISQTVQDSGWCQYNTYRKPNTAERMITWLMTSRDLDTFQPQYLTIPWR